MSASSRRSILAGTPLAAMFAAMPCVTLGQINADKKLIELCKQHIANMEAFCACPLDSDVSPHWPPYEATEDAVAKAQPMTLAGLAAKARVAKAEALQPDGKEVYANSAAGNWAWDLVNDLIRLTGGAA
jgi:hypothetical protein